MAESYNKTLRPEPGEPEIKQQKIKPASPLITEIKPPKPGTGGQVPKKSPSEPLPPIKPKT
jgi:hypothetical protein